MDSGLFDVLEQPADDDVVPIGDTIDIHLDGVLEELVDEDRLSLGVGHSLERDSHVARELFLGVDDLHCTPAEHVARSNHDGESDLLSDGERVLGALGDPAIRTLEVQLGEQLVEALPVLGAVDGVRRGTEDRHPGPREGHRQLQGRLATELHDDAIRLLDVDDVHHVFVRQRLEVELVGRVVVGRDGLRIAVDHDGLEPDLFERERRVHAAIVELDALPDSVRAATEDHHLLLVALGPCLAVEAPGGVHVRRERRELRGTRIDSRVDGLHPERGARGTHVIGFLPAEPRDLPVAESKLFGLPKQRLIEGMPARRFKRHLEVDELAHLLEEPDVDVRGLMNVVDGEADAEAVTDVPEALCEWGLDQVTNRFAKVFVGRIRQVSEHRLRGVDRFASIDEPAHLCRQIAVVHLVEERAQAVTPGLERARSLLERLLEGATDRHGLTDRLHLRGQSRVCARELLEGEARHLGDHVVDGGLEGRTGPGDVVLKLVETVADSKFGGDLRDRVARRLRCERTRTRHARVHLDDDEPAIFRVDGELDIRAASLHTDLGDDRPARVAKTLVLPVGERHRGRHGDRVARMHAHRIEVLDGADHGEVVRIVADDLELEFLPSEQTLFDEALVDRAALECPADRFFEFGLVVGDAAAGAAHGERGTQDDREADALGDVVGVFHGARDFSPGALEPDLVHGRLEELPLLGLANRVDLGADELDPVLLEDAPLVQLEGQVERGLPTERREHGVGLLALDDRLDYLWSKRLDIRPVGELRVRHDGRRVRVDQDDPVPFFPKRLGTLSAGVVELAGLSDDDRPRTY